MKMVMRPRYYCDHCKKVSGSPSAMRRHEQGCTANPARVCTMHEKVTGGEDQPTREELLGAFMDPALGQDWKARMKALRESAHECPGCILFTIRQSGVTKRSMDPELGWWGPLPDEMSWPSPYGDTCTLGFNFKRELQSAWSEYNENQSASDHGY